MNSNSAKIGGGECGLSLLELVAAIFVLTVGVMAVIQSQFVVLDKMRDVNEYHVATRALVNELEYLRALPFEGLAAGEGLPFRSVTPALERLHAAEGRVTIHPRAQGLPGLNEVMVQIRWRGEHGRWIEKRMDTLVARRDGSL